VASGRDDFGQYPVKDRSLRQILRAPHQAAIFSANTTQFRCLFDAAQCARLKPCSKLTDVLRSHNAKESAWLVLE
jgi:hypothetical protein